MPKIKITPKKGEKGYRGPGAKPKPKQKTAKGSQPTTKGRQAAKTKQSTISTYIAPSIAAGGARKRGVTAPAQTDPPAKRQRTRGVRQPEPEDDNDSQDAIGKEDSSFAKGRVVSGKGKAKELVGGREARSRAARAGGARRKGVERGGVSKGLSGGTLIEEELERDGNMPRRSQRTRTATEQATYDSDGDYGRGEASVGGKAQKGGRKRGQQARHTRGSHASSDSDDGGSKLSGRAGRGGQEGGQGGRRLSSDSDGEVGGRATGKGERRKRGRMNKGAGRVSSDSDEGGSSKSLGKTREAGGGVPGRGSQTKETSEAMEEEKERATDGGRKRASVREVTIAGSSAAKWEAISEEADRVIGDAMVSAMGQCVQGLPGGRRQRTEQELQHLISRVQHKLRSSKGPMTGRMKTYTSARQKTGELKEKCLELLQSNQLLEERLEERLTSVDERKQMVEQLAGMLSSSERPLQTPIELLDLPEQVQRAGDKEEEEEEDQEFLEELVVFLSRSRQSSARVGANGSLQSALQ